MASEHMERESTSLVVKKKKNAVSKQWNIIFSSVSLLTGKSEKD